MLKTGKQEGTNEHYSLYFNYYSSPMSFILIAVKRKAFGPKGTDHAGLEVWNFLAN
jgi:hypothetical protein